VGSVNFTLFLLKLAVLVGNDKTMKEAKVSIQIAVRAVFNKWLADSLWWLGWLSLDWLHDRSGLT